MRRWLKSLRVALAFLLLVILGAAFLDFRGAVPATLAHGFANVQLGPAALAAASGGALAIAALVSVFAITLLFGRVYCSVVCPLGILQDLVVRLRRHRSAPLRFVPENKRVRYGVLVAVVLAIALGGIGVAATLLDPYSHFGRIVATLGRPLVIVANNALVPVAQALDLHALYRVPLHLPPIELVVFALVVVAIVAGLAVWRGRIYCNTLCPVGTVLGLLSRVSAFRLAIDRSACTKCADCLRACKAQCIDLRTGDVDASRCVACANCLGACAHGGIRYCFTWRRSPTRPANPERRAVVAGALLLPPLATIEAVAPATAPARRPAIAPPGAHSVDRLLDRCTGCQLCVSACPTGVLQPAVLDYGWAGFAKPHLDFNRAFCNFDCRRCGEVCPTGAISLLELADKRLTSVGIAKFERTLCIVETDGTDCAACSEHCPTKAVDTIPFRDNLRLPQVKEELCIGCGACEFACPVRPVRAITVATRAKHTRAEKAVEAKPTLPKPTGDFPF